MSMTIDELRERCLNFEEVLVRSDDPLSWPSCVHLVAWMHNLLDVAEAAGHYVNASPAQVEQCYLALLSALRAVKEIQS